MSDHAQLILSRSLMGTSLGFHILFALFGVGLPLMISIAHFIGLWYNKPNYLVMARRWSSAFAMLFAIGAVSGTIISKLLSLLWPVFMKTAGKVITLPIFLEGYAFFIEAIFLGIYLYGKDRITNKWIHWAMSLPIAVGGLASSFFITTMDSWMNHPAGFDVVDGEIVNVNPWKAMFNPATFTETSHSNAAYYATCAFVLAMVYAVPILRRKAHLYHKQAFHLCMVVAAVFSLLTGLTGDAAGKYIAKHQPAKLAAAEWLMETTTYAPLTLGGIIVDGEVKYGIEIPWLLSVLAFNDPSKEVIGLNDIPEDERPPLVIHYFFDIMVATGGMMAGIAVLYLGFVFLKKKELAEKPLYLWSVVACAIGSLIAIEAGWMVTCMGRQPWIIRGFMRTSEAVTKSADVAKAAVTYGILYMVLMVGTFVMLRLYYKRKPLNFDGEEAKEK